MVLPVLFGLGTAAFQGLGAISNYQQGQAETDAINLSRTNKYRDALKLRSYKYEKEKALYNQQLATYGADLYESEIALEKAFTRIDKQQAERYGAAAFAKQDRVARGIKAEGDLLGTLPSGGSRDRALALLRAQQGREDAAEQYNLVRSRFAAIDRGRDLTDKANAYRRQLFNRLPLPPTLAPMPTAPIMQQGPSALSLISGLGQAAMSGITAGMGLAESLGGGGGGGVPDPVPGASNFSNFQGNIPGYGGTQMTSNPLAGLLGG